MKKTNPILLGIIIVIFLEIVIAILLGIITIFLITTHDEENRNNQSNNDHIHTYIIQSNETMHWKECSCGEKIDEENHIFEEWIINVEATEETTGIKERECSVCHYKETETISSKGLAYTLNIDNKSYSVSSIGTVTNKDIIIPSTYDGKPVTSIGDYAFRSCSSLTSIVIPDSVTSIGGWAFYGCSSLESIVIPESVTSIGRSAFYFCSSLTSISLPFVGASKDGTSNTHFGHIFGAGSYSSNASYVPSSLKEVIITGGTSIGDNAFRSCSKLTNIVIPASITSIGDYAFSSCSNLESITIGNGVTSIGSYAFWGCSSLDKVYYEGTLEDWCKITFSDYSSNPMYYANHLYLRNNNNQWEEVTSIEIPNTITKIGAYQFYGFNNVISIVIPDSVISIGSSAFSSCYRLVEIYNLSSLNIANNVGYAKVIHTSLAEESCLYEKENFVFIKDENNKYYLIAYKGQETKLVLPNEVDGQNFEINQHAFRNCSSIESIVIPASVTSIGSHAFYNCSSLEKVFHEGTLEDWCNISFGSYYSNPMYYANHYYLRNNSNQWEEVTSIEIPNTITKIVEYQFYGFNNVTSIVIPDSVTSIGGDAFFGCSSLESIVIPDSVTSIGGSAFSGCSSLTSIVIPDSVTSIGEDTFHNCSSLESIVIPDSVTSIGYGVFWCCSSLESIVIPDSVTSIGEDAFNGCSSLESIVIPNSVTSIGGSAFSGCSSLTSIVIPDSVTSIGSSAFSGCSSLTSIVIPDSVTSIGDSAFYGCSSLTSITIPFVGASKDGTSNPHFGYIFGASSYSSNSSYVPSGLKEVIITGGASIGSYAFYYCSSLTSILIPESVTNIGNYAFYNCSNLEKVYYEGKIEEWNEISISSLNSPLSSATRYYYSETQPTSTGNYWHYVDGVVTIW